MKLFSSPSCFHKFFTFCISSRITRPISTQLTSLDERDLGRFSSNGGSCTFPRGANDSIIDSRMSNVAQGVSMVVLATTHPSPVIL